MNSLISEDRWINVVLEDTFNSSFSEIMDDENITNLINMETLRDEVKITVYNKAELFFQKMQELHLFEKFRSRENVSNLLTRLMDSLGNNEACIEIIENISEDYQVNFYLTGLELEIGTILDLSPSLHSLSTMFFGHSILSNRFGERNNNYLLFHRIAVLACIYLGFTLNPVEEMPELPRLVRQNAVILDDNYYMDDEDEKEQEEEHIFVESQRFLDEDEKEE